LLTALPLALLVHAVVVALIVASAGPAAIKSARAPSRPVSLRPLSAAQWTSNRGRAGRSLPVPERPAPLHPKGQVVDVAPGNNRTPVESKYLAETNNRIERETRAREQTNVWSRATPKTQANPTAAPAAKGQPAPPAQSAPPPSFLPSLLGRRPLPVFDEPHSPGGTEASAKSEEPSPIGTANGTERSGGDATEGGGAPNDDLSNLPAGDGTFLNTREWRYASFFNRVKQAVSARWDPNGRLRSRNRDVGSGDRMTLVHVSLRPDGSLAEAYVAKSSGVDELDQEAIRSFEKAQPFANPPAALVENGRIRFSFGFTVTSGELGGGLPRFLRFGR
jgi:TonB family protein